MAVTRVGHTELDGEADEPSPPFEGIGALGWASLFAIGLLAFVLVTIF